MPLYEYECKKCHHRIEKIQSFSARHIKKCPDCGGLLEQVISAPAVQFKGSGWYVTDYAKKSSAPASPASNGDSASKGESGSSADSSSKDDSGSKGDSSSKSESSSKGESGSKKEGKSKSESSSKKSDKK
jgi:putative FmdB family regulatory protein